MWIWLCAFITSEYTNEVIIFTFAVSSNQMASKLVLCRRKRALSYMLCCLTTMFIPSLILTTKSQREGVDLDDTRAFIKSLQPSPTSAAVTNASVQLRTSMKVKVTNVSKEGSITPCCSSGSLFWPNDQEWNVQPLFRKREATIFMEKIHSLRVVSLERGCSTSKPTNRLATLEDGTKVCCRYMRIGNVYSYHLNWLLGLRNIPPATAVKFNQSNEKWRSVRDAALNAGWRDGRTVLMELFIENLTEVYMSPYFSDSKTSVTSVQRWNYPHLIRI